MAFIRIVDKVNAMSGSKVKKSVIIMKTIMLNIIFEYHNFFGGRNFATEEAAPPGAEVVLVEKLEPLHIMTVGINRSQFRTLLPKN